MIGREEGERLTSLSDVRSYHYTHIPRCGRRAQLFCLKDGSPRCCAIYARDENERLRKEGGIGRSGGGGGEKERSMKKGAEMTRRMEDEEAKTQKGQ